MIAALTGTIIAPAKAGPVDEPLLPLASASLPKVAVPELLDPAAEPQLSEPKANGGENAPNANDAADAPLTKPRGDLASMVAQLRSSDPGSRELECLATGVYYEAKSEPLAGQLAVAQVIVNRAESRGRFPSSYCGVLFQRGQFSFIRGKSLPRAPRASKQWQNAVAIAKIADQDLKESSVGEALFFHARYVSPRWRLKRVASVGNHIFYR